MDYQMMIDKLHTVATNHPFEDQNLNSYKDGLLNNKERVNKRSEQMKKRLDKLSGHELITNIDAANINEHTNTPNKKKTHKNTNFSMHRSTTSIIGYDSEKGVVYETNDYPPSSSIDYSSPVKKLKVVERSKDIEVSPHEELNISNFDSSFNTIDADIGDHRESATENQRIIESNSLFQKPNSSFIPIKNNLALIILQKEASNVTDSYYMALYGEKSDINQKSINNKDVLSSDVIEEEESFRESDLQTPKNEKLTNNKLNFTPQSLSIKWSKKSHLSLSKPSSSKGVSEHQKLNTEGNYNTSKINNTDTSSIQQRHGQVKYDTLHKKSQYSANQPINKYHKESISISAKNDLNLEKKSSNQNSSKEILCVKKVGFRPEHNKFRVKTNHSKSDGRQVSEALSYMSHIESKGITQSNQEEGNFKQVNDMTQSLKSETKLAAKSLTKIRHKYETSFNVVSTMKKLVQNENSINSESCKSNTKLKSKSIEKNSNKLMRIANLTFPNPPSTKSIKHINPQTKEYLNSKFNNKHNATAGNKNKELKFKIVEIKHTKIKHDPNYYFVSSDHLCNLESPQIVEEKSSNTALPSVSFRGGSKPTIGNEEKAVHKSHKYSSSAKS